MGRPRIVVAGIGPRLHGSTWEAAGILRLGSQDNMDIVLRDASVRRCHAEIQYTGAHWVLRELDGRPCPQTFLNGIKLGRGDYRLKPDDLIQCGHLTLQVTALEDSTFADKNGVPAKPTPHLGEPHLTQREQFIQTVTSLARAVELRDQYTGDHTRRVTDYALLLAEELKLPATQKYQIQIGAPLHDIGKIGIADAILGKPGRLTPAEFELMKLHTVKGAAILESICNLTPMIPIVRHHHERWDGSGYPDRLSGDNIAVTARIVAVADAFDAMTSERPYRHAMPADAAFRELFHKSGSHFDPACVGAFARLRPRVEERLLQDNLHSSAP